MNAKTLRDEELRSQLDFVVSFGLITSLVLFIAGLVGILRGRIDRRWLTTPWRSLILFACGVLLLFTVLPPPLRAVGEAEGRFTLPPTAEEMYAQVVPQVANSMEPNADLLPEQQAAFPMWERQVMTAHRAADKALAGVGQVMEALEKGEIDRFTAWVRFGVLSQDLKQADLLLHEVVPPAKLNLADQYVLRDALNRLHASLDQKRAGIQALQEYTQDLSPAHLEKANRQMELGNELLIEALEYIGQVKGRLGL